MRRSAAFGVVALASALAGTARGQGGPTAEAERRSRRAVRFYQDGRYEEALRLFQAAHNLHPVPRHLFNIALAKEKVFDYEGCAVAFRRYLDETQDAQAKDEAAANRPYAEAGLTRCRGQARMPVRVSSIPAAAAIVVDDGREKSPRGRTPRELSLPPGRYTVAVELPGYLPASQEVVVDVGVRPEIDFPLEKLSSLRVEVDPAGARARIEEGAWENAPLTRELRGGAYRVEVEKAGYERVARKVTVEPGQNVSLVLTLTKMPVRRVVSFEAEPEATLSIDDRIVGRGSLRQRLSPGAHEVVVTAPRRLPFAGDIVVPEERDLRLRVRLQTARRRRTDRIVTWSLLGGSAAAAAASAAYGVLALRDQRAFSDEQSPELGARGQSRADRADFLLGAAVVMGTAAFVYHYFVSKPAASRLEIVR
jgi:hypothetical protein